MSLASSLQYSNFESTIPVPGWWLLRGSHGVKMGPLVRPHSTSQRISTVEILARSQITCYKYPNWPAQANPGSFDQSFLGG